MSFGEQVKFWRHGRGMTQQQLAERAGMHVVQISKLERNDSNPQLGTMRKVAKALGAKLSVTLKPLDGNLEITPWEPLSGRPLR